MSSIVRPDSCCKPSSKLNAWTHLCSPLHSVQWLVNTSADLREHHHLLTPVIGKMANEISQNNRKSITYTKNV